ncbi:GLOBIN domain-containing protein [Mycena venus]|uniref:GLOBIN domain-containing protein n=1 Tax=Mycena venus TaxID=2733690 RepID=A0A8H6YRQ7_9AGAR|nr:GLOBIN domain-containing protein [Mycena venus]
MPPAAKPPSTPVDNALACPAYFMSPAETLLESTGPNGDDISLHDLIEAYNTFSLRIRAQIRAILNADPPPPALISLQECSHEIGEVLRRDLKRTRDEPSFQSRHTSFAQNSFQSELDEEEMRVARDLALLSHQVLRFLSDILSFPPLYSIFSTNDLRSIFNELLVLGSAPYIPGPTSRRTWTLVVFILSSQYLPPEVLSPAKREIVSVLKRALEGEIGKVQAKLDGLQASTHLLKQHPSLFISPLLAVFPCILNHLVADSSILRLQAVNALGRFALAKINTLSTTANSCHPSISETLTTFINAETSKLKSVQSQLRLRNLVTAALTVRNPSHPADSPFWAVQLLASFSLQQVAAHKQKLVIALHPYVWKCLVWVFSRIPIHTDDDGDDGIRDPVFQTLKQDLRGGIGLALILSLLGSAANGVCDTADSVSKVLQVVKDMLSHNDHLIQAEGVALLTQLLYTPTPPTVPASAQMLDIWVPQLFDGSILQATRDGVIATIRSLPRLDPSQVRPLSDSEIVAHWDVLADLWVQATNISLGPEFDELKLRRPYLCMAEYRQNLLHGWQSLLLMPSDLTQGFLHLTTEEPFASKIAALICSFIVPTDTADAHAQVQRLVLVRKMWHTMTNVFQRDWLAWPAETVLGAVLKHGYDLADEQIRDTWAELCAELLSLGLPCAVGVVREQGDEARMPSELQRQLWALAVKSMQKSDVAAPWRDVAYLLSIPFGAWTMTTAEVEIWDRLLCTSIAQDNSVPPTVFVEQVFESIKDAARLSESPREFLALLSYVDLADRSELPRAITTTVAEVLGDLYPRQALESTSIRIIRQLRDVFLSAPSTLTLPFLLALQDSICKWLEDDEDVLVGDVREEITHCLFSIPLSTICDLEPTGPNLVSISRFLATLANANAFESFWRVTYHGRDEFYDLYPESIKTSLKAFTDIFGGSLAADLSLENHSQMESSVVLDSQPSQAGPSSSFDYYADESKYPFEADTIGVGDTGFMDVDEREGHSVSTVRPPSPSIHLPEVQPRPVLSSALEQLQEYSSRLDESSVLSLMNTSGSSHSSGTARGHPSQVPSQSSYSARSKSGILKRRAKVDDSSSVSNKRRKTSPHTRSGWLESSNAVAGPSRHPGQSISEPVTRRVSPVLSDHALSQSVLFRKRRKGKRKLVLDYVEVPTYEETRRRRQECSLPTPSPSFRPPPGRQSSKTGPAADEDGEDYASWEAGLSIAEVKEVQHAFDISTEYHSSDDGKFSSPHHMDTDQSRRDVPFPSSSLSRRSQTAPIPRREKHPAPLRRNKTSARLDALEHAYAVVADADDASQVPVQDLMQATRLVHKIGAALNEQMSRKLDKS